MFRLENVCKKYDREVLKNINISFDSKGLICLVGESGSGKSTLLNILARLTSYDSGNVYFGGNKLESINNSLYHNKCVSMIFQNYNLIDDLSVKDNILLGTDFVPDSYEDIISKMGIKYLENRCVNCLSGGEAQRVAIARSLIMDTSVILADEPTGALDSDNSLKVMEILKDVSKSKLVIVVTHSDYLANMFADKVIRLKDGLINDDNIYVSNYLEVKSNKFKFKFSKMFKLTFNNIRHNFVRNILIVCAFVIGLFSFGMILCINKGFGVVLDDLNENTFYNYPIVISSEVLSDSYDSENYNLNGYKVRENKILRNNLDSSFFELIKSIDKKYYDSISYIKNISYDFKSISYVIPSNNYFDLIEGRYPVNRNEVMILMDSNGAIDKSIFNYLDVEKNGLINNNFIVDGVSLKVVGVVKSTYDYLADMSKILYYDDVFNGDITDVIIYPSSYDNKLIIKDFLSSYYVVDDSFEAINLVNSVVKGITFILLFFCFISLFVTVIMFMVISYISFLERLREVGILKSIGVSNRRIKILFLLYNYSIGLFSSFVSILLLTYGTRITNRLVFDNLGIENICNFSIGIVLVIILVSLLLSYISGVIPSLKASRKEIIDIIKNN